MSDEIEVVKIQKIDIQDGDVLAVYVPAPLSAEDTERITRRLQDFFLPKIVKVAIFSQDVTLEVLRAK